MLDDDLVEKLHGLLAEALHRSRPDPFNAPVTVAEMYQDLVPYRSVRTALGFQMNADYEHTLLRLLAGEGGHARLEPPEAREELSAELETPNPNVGLFRKFAACDVWITPAAVPAGTPGFASGAAPAIAPELPTLSPALPAPEPPAKQVTGRAETNESWEKPAATPQQEWDDLEEELLLEEEVELPDTSAQAVSQPARPPKSSEPTPKAMFETKTSHASIAEPVTTGSCAFCRTGLPAGRMVRYCPFCGADQSLKPCATCREPLEPSWKFCIACGTRQG
jgi:hypothetical protein